MNESLSPAEEERLRASPGYQRLAEELRQTAEKLQRLQQELDWKTAFFEAVANASIDGVIVVDAQGKKILQNHRTADLFKIPGHIIGDKDDAQQVRWVTGMMKVPGPFVEKVIYLYSHPEEISRDELELKDGTMIDRYSSPVTGKDGQYYGRIWTFRDITERKRTEAIVHRLAAIVEHSDEAIISEALTGRITSWNPAAERMFGYTAAEIVGQPLQVLIPPEHPGEEAEILARFVGGEVIQRFETVRIRKDGQRLEVSVALSPLKDSAGGLAGVSKIVRDITGRKRTERALQESQLRYRSLFENMLEGYAYCRMLLERDQPQDFIYLEVNGAFKTLTGLADVVGEKVSAVIPGLHESNPELFEAYHRVALTGKPERFETRVASLGIWFSVAVYSHEKGYFATVFDNITERKQAEEALRLLDSAVKQSGESILITEAELDFPGPRITFVNPAFTAMTGYTAAEAVGQTPRVLQGPLTDKTVLRRLRQALERGEPFSGEAINYRKDGAPFVLEWQVAPIRDPSGKVTHFVAIQRDITERKRTETALRESNEKFQQLADNITDVFWIRSPDLTAVHYVSPAFERIWGRPVAALYASPHQWVDFILPEDRERVETAFAALKGEVPSLDIEYRILRPDGAIRWLRVRGFQVRDAAGQLIRHTGIVTDITQMKQTEASLVETSGLLLALLENTNDLIYFKDRDSRFVQFSREMLNLFHLTRPAELRGRTDFDFFSEEHARASFATEQEILRTGQAVLNLEEKETCPNGRVTWALTSKMPRRDTAGAVIGTMGISRDITERKRVETALRASEERLSSLIENARDAIFTIAADGTFTSLNPAVAAISGINRAEWIGKPFALMVHPDDLPLAHKMFQCVLHGGLAPVHELRGNPGLSRAALVEMTLTAQKDEAGKIIGVLGIGRDITDRKRLESRLFESQKLETVGKLAGGVAHEFNSILTAIIGQSELLLLDLPSAGGQHDSVVAIRQAADRAAMLTRQLLAYGRKQILQPEILNLNAVLASMESTVRHLSGPDTNIRFAPATDQRSVKADARQIEQVIMNMVINAHDAMPNGGLLTLEIANVTLEAEYLSRFPESEARAGPYVMLAISDTGVGMNAAVKARVFEPFFSTKAAGLGTGLGLSTCFGIVKQSGGHLTVYSEPGRGTTFKIYLPQVEAAAPPASPRLDAPALPRGTETVLLVEDDPALREMAATLLRRLGYTVFAAADGLEALSLCHQRETGRINLLFTDVVMPHMSGGELADRIRAMYPHTRILFTSAYTETAIVHQGVLDSGVALLQKPFSPSALAQKLREILDQAPTNK